MTKDAPAQIYAPPGKARWDCECGNMHYASIRCKSVHCPRCHMPMEKAK